MFKKNTAVTGFTVGLVSATDGSAITTGTPVGYYTLDGGTQTAIGDVTPVHEGNGQWSFDLTAGEMNGDIVGLTFTHASAIPAFFTIKTDTKIVSELQDLTAAQVNAEVDTGITDAALATAANLATAQADLDTITGADGATLATSQGAITWGAVTISVAGTTSNINFNGSGTGAVFDFTRGGTSSLFGTEYSTSLQAEVNAACDTALTDYDAATGTELAATEAKIDIIDTNVDAVLVDTNELQGDWANGGRLDLILDELTTQGDTNETAIGALNNISVADILTTQMTEAYAADGTAPTLAQALFLIQQTIGDFSITGTTVSVYQLDGTTAAATYTLDSSTAPTSRTRSS